MIGIDEVGATECGRCPLGCLTLYRVVEINHCPGEGQKFGVSVGHDRVPLVGRCGPSLVDVLPFVLEIGVVPSTQPG